MIGFDLGSETGRERARLAIENFGIAFFESDMVSRLVTVTPNAFAMFGLPVPDHMPVASTGFWECYHPDDREAARAIFESDLRGARNRDVYCERVRIIRQTDGAIRWIEFLGRMFGPPGARTHIVGMLRDVTEAVEAEERQALLMREVKHRANNTLAVVQSLVRLTRGTDVPDYQRSLEGRILSLARTQSLIERTDGGCSSLAALVAAELAAYLDHIDLSLRAPPPLAAAAVQPVAMILHELATNAAKHGAFALTGGRVRLEAVTAGAEVVLRWSEVGGPAIAAPPSRKGTGMSVILAQVRRLGGCWQAEWHPEGLVSELRIPLARWGGTAQPRAKP